MFASQEPAFWKDLETKGYTILRNALDKADLDSLNAESEKAIVATEAYKPCPIGPQNLQHLKNKFISELIAELQKKTDIHADLLLFGNYFAKKNGANFSWHTDNSDFYIVQDFYNFINVYIPIQKPLLEKTNLTLLPFDRFEQYAPELAKRFKGRGASQIVERNGKSTIYDNNDGKVYSIPFLVSDISVTPHLNSGDMLIVRGDVFHKTQDAETLRVSASLRIFNSKAIVNEVDLYSDNIYKAQSLSGTLGKDLLIRRKVFKDSKKVKMTFGEVEERFRALRNDPEFKVPFDLEKAKYESIIKVIAQKPEARIFVLANAKTTSDIQPYVDAANAVEQAALFVQQVPGTNGFRHIKSTGRWYGEIAVQNLDLILSLIRSSGIEVVSLSPQASFEPPQTVNSNGGKVAYLVDCSKLAP